MITSARWGNHRGVAGGVTIAAEAATSDGQEAASGTSNAINATTTIASIPITTTAATTGSVAGG